MKSHLLGKETPYMKKFIAILLTLTMLLSLAACASTEAPEAPVAPEAPEQSAPVVPPDMEEEPEAPTEPTDEPVAPEEEAPVEDDPVVEGPEEGPVEDTPVEDVPMEEPAADPLQPVLDAVLAGIDAEFTQYFSPMPIEGDAETVGWMLGVEPMPEGYSKILSYGPMHGSTPFILAVIELTEGTEARVFETAMMDNANLIKWVCVEAEYVQAASNGNLVLFMMSDTMTCSEDVRDQMFANFAAYAG